MEIGVVVPTVNCSWSDTLRWATRAEEVGFDSVWVIDHLDSSPPGRGILESWTVLSALAVSTARVGLGAQVFCNTFRNPGLFAKMATTFQLISGGRLRVLIGAGWNASEHTSFGLPFPPPGERVDRLSEALQICRTFWDSGGAPISFSGKHWQLTNGRNLPPPAERIRLGVGGSGDRLLRTAAAIADEWNCPAQQLDRYPQLAEKANRVAAEAGRQDLRRSVQAVFTPDGVPSDNTRQAFRPEYGLWGSVDQMVTRIQELRALGVSGLYGYVDGITQLEAMGARLSVLREAAAGG